jgi:hypothetical protein
MVQGAYHSLMKLSCHKPPIRVAMREREGGSEFIINDTPVGSPVDLSSEEEETYCHMSDVSLLILTFYERYSRGVAR